MKIALVSPYSFAYHGGVQEHVKALRAVLKTSGHQVKILSPRSLGETNIGNDFILLGGSIVVPGNDSRVDISYSFPSEIEKLVVSEDFDLFHFHSFQPFLSFQILDCLKNPKTIKILTSHSNNQGSLLSTAFGGIMNLAVDSFISRMDGIISVSKAAEKLISHFSGTKVIIPNGVELTRFSPDVKVIEKFKDGKFNLLFVGRLDPRKGAQVLLSSFALLKKRYENLRLIIVGDGFLKGELSSKISREGLKDVVLAGEVNNEDLPAYYKTADIFCAPSIRGESFGLILIEAMASGVSLIASDIEGYREVVPSVDFLTPPGDPVSLALAIEALIENTERRSKIVAAGLKKVREYDWKRVGVQIEEFYTKVAEAKKVLIGSTRKS